MPLLLAAEETGLFDGGSMHESVYAPLKKPETAGSDIVLFPGKPKSHLDFCNPLVPEFERLCIAQ